jgi:ribosome maturation factor RimP
MQSTTTLLLLASMPPLCHAFVAPEPKPITHLAHQLDARKPSTVTDPSGPTPPESTDPFPVVDIETLPEAHYDENKHPIPHQPWRRGLTDGCEDPISVWWRLRAQDIVSDAVNLVGGKVVDYTWYLGQLVISLDPDFSNVVSYVSGPPVKIVYPDETDVTGHIWEDPDAGTDNELFTEEDEFLDYEQYDEETEWEILKANMVDENGNPKQPRTRDERMLELAEERAERFAEEELIETKDFDGNFAHAVDTKALSVISQAIMTALEDETVEEELRILSRHDITLTSPLNNPCILESQSEFDAARDKDVYVETRDPWGSNRVLGGKLVDRNTMDVIINQDNSGRMVTIPHSMIHQVLLPSGLAVVSERYKKELEEMMSEDEDYDEDEE